MPYRILLGIPALNFSLKGNRAWKELEAGVIVRGRQIKGLTLREAFMWRLPVPPELLTDLPYAIKVSQSKNKTYPDVGESGEYCCTAYSRAAKNVIESLDPGIHQFFPIAKTLNRHDEEIDFPYFIGIISPLPNAIDVERSPVHFTRVSPQSDREVLTLSQGQAAADKIMTLRSEVIAGRHIWGGRQECSITATFAPTFFLSGGNQRICRVSTFNVASRFDGIIEVSAKRKFGSGLKINSDTRIFEPSSPQ